MPAFVPGLILSRGFYYDCVRPIMERHFPALRYSAALLGTGSDVVGFDTARSMDHHWGPRLYLYVAAEDAHQRQPILDALADNLPVEYRGFPTNFTRPEDDPEGHGIRNMQPIKRGPVNHMVTVAELGRALTRWLGFDPRGDVDLRHWLSTPSQKLLEVTAGDIFHDTLGDLTAVRAVNPVDGQG